MIIAKEMAGSLTVKAGYNLQKKQVGFRVEQLPMREYLIDLAPSEV